MSLFFHALNPASTRAYYNNNTDNQGDHGGPLTCVYGQCFRYHAFRDGGRHIDSETLERVYRHQGDDAMDRILELRSQEGRPVGAAQDLIVISQQQQQSQSPQYPSDQALTKLLQYHAQLPSWVDVESLQRGQDVYLLYLPCMAISHYYRSLVPGFSSVPQIAAVLQATAYLAPPSNSVQVQRRLRDTGAFLAVIAALPISELVQSNGVAWKTALQVRVLHAKVRRALLMRNKGTTKQSRQWNTQQLGVPINQEDMAITLLAFAQNALVGCEIILGRPLPIQERLDYLHLWRYVGWLLGVDVYDHPHHPQEGGTTKPEQQQDHKPLDPCGPGWIDQQPDPLHHSVAMMESMLLHLMKPNDASIPMAHHLLRLGQRPSNSNNNKTLPATKTPHSKDDPSTINNSKDSSMPSSFFSLLVKQDKQNWFSSETMFYFRSLQCRRWVGDPLADALQLPLHPAWTWQRIRWSVVAELYAGCLRLYTWLGQWPCGRTIWIRRHRGVMQNFWQQWQMEQQQPPPKQQQQQPDNSSTNENMGNEGGAVSCPFAMVAPPVH